MHQIVCTKSRWGSLQRSQKLPSWLSGGLLLRRRRRDERGREEKGAEGRGGEGSEKGKGRDGKGEGEG